MAEEISTFDIAIMDCLKSIIEVVVAKKVANYVDFAAIFESQAKTALTQNNGKAAGVFTMMQAFCSSHQSARALIDTPHAGSA